MEWHGLLRDNGQNGVGPTWIPYQDSRRMRACAALAFSSPHQDRNFLTSFTNARTRLIETLPHHTPPSFTLVPTIAPSALPSSSVAFSTESPLPTITGKNVPRRMFSISPIGVGSPV